jgi:hypothetical protein
MTDLGERVLAALMFFLVFLAVAIMVGGILALVFA